MDSRPLPRLERTRTLIRVDENYKIVERKAHNEKELPNKFLDLIIPILKKENWQGSRKEAIS